MGEPFSHVAAGVRQDVSKAPLWIQELIESPMVEAGIVQKDFLNAFTMNVYHDGTEGLAQHYDDATRFR